MKKTFTRCTLSLLLGIFNLAAPALQAQSPTLSVQGVLKKSDGSAVDDNSYDITFTLWKSEAGTDMNVDFAWSDVIPVETKGGVYSAVLGSKKVLDAPFDGIYYLGVKVAGANQELRPRPRLTHAPYAMALLGERNRFPSKGPVLADTVSLSAIEVPSGTSAVKVASDLNLVPGKSIQYNGLSDWRLVQVDDFDNGPNGWAGYTEPDNSSPVAAGVEVVANAEDFDGFTHNLLTRGSGMPTDNDYYFKKMYNLNNTPHTKIKIVFSIISGVGSNSDFSPEIYIGSSLGNMEDFQALLVGRNEVILNTDSNTFVIGIEADEVEIFPGIFTTPRFYLDDIEIWVK